MNLRKITRRTITHNTRTQHYEFNWLADDSKFPANACSVAYRPQLVGIQLKRTNSNWPLWWYRTRKNCSCTNNSQIYIPPLRPLPLASESVISSCVCAIPSDRRGRWGQHTHCEYNGEFVSSDIHTRARAAKWCKTVGTDIHRLW